MVPASHAYILGMVGDSVVQRGVMMHMGASLLLAAVSYLVCGSNAMGGLLVMSMAVTVMAVENTGLKTRVRECMTGEASTISLERAVTSLLRRNAELERDLRLAEKRSIVTERKPRLWRGSHMHHSESDLMTCGSSP